MKITWVVRSFLDYRIPIYSEINRLCGNQLTVIYYADVVPVRCQQKLQTILGERNIGLSGEFRLTGKKTQPISSIKKNGIRIPVQPGLIREIKKSKPDLLLCDGFFQWTYAAIWLRFWNKIPLVMLYEGTEHTERNAGRIRTYYRKLVSGLMDQISCNGILSTKYIASLGYPENKINTGNMAADTEGLTELRAHFSTGEVQNLKAELGLNQYVFLFTGRLVPLKGVDKLLSVWFKTFASEKDASLLIVGGGAEKEILQNKCIENNCENVVFTGEVDYDLIYRYFAVSNVFVIPTLQDNWSLVVPEAMACGLPVICSKYNGCWPELVRPENGWVFDPLNSEDFTEKLKSTWNIREKWFSMGKNSLNIVENYTPPKVASKIYQACTNATLKKAPHTSSFSVKRIISDVKGNAIPWAKKHPPFYFFLLVIKKIRADFFSWRFNQKELIAYTYKKVTGEELNLENPTRFTEKLQWMKLNYTNPNMKICADKVAVRKYIENKGYKSLLNKVLGIYNTPDEIALEELPERFVLKTSHSSGWNVICTDKDKFIKNWFWWKKILKLWLNEDYSKYYQETHYKGIKPQLICEKFQGSVKTGLNDYKFYCFHGKVKYIQVDIERYTDHKQNFYDENWNFITVHAGLKRFSNHEQLKPKKLDEMIKISQHLAKDFLHVRVDFFEWNDEIFFAELTFCDGAGYYKSEPPDLDYKIGEYLVLPNIQHA